MNLPKPIAVTQWRTSDGQLHDSMDVAERHEVVTEVLKNTPERLQPIRAELYPLFMELAKYMHFVPAQASAGPISRLDLSRIPRGFA